MTMVRLVGVVIVAAGVLAGPAGSAPARGQDAAPAAQSARQVGEALSRARLKYEQDMHAVRDAVLTEEARVREGVKYLENERDKKPGARKPAKKPAQPPRKMGEWREGDAWPAELQPADKAKFEGLRREMLGAYDAAIAGFTRLKNEELLAAVTEERARFAATGDELPWDAALMSPGSSMSKSEVQVMRPVKHSGDYRMIFIGKKRTKDTELELSVPYQVADRVPLEIDYAADGSFAVAITVQRGKDGQGGGISADMGVARPIDVSNAKGWPDRSIVMWVHKGAVDVTVLAVKPLPGADGKLAESTVAAGKALRGTMTMGKDGTAKAVSEAKVVSMSETELVIRHLLPESGTPAVWTFRRNGDQLWLTSLTGDGGASTGFEIRKPVGIGPGPEREHLRASQGRIDGGTITWGCSLVQPQPGRPVELTKGTPVRVEMTVVE